MLVTGAIPVFVTTTLKGTVSPMAVLVVVEVFTSETFGAETDVVRTLDKAEPVKRRPSGGI
ncbi:hypothetical protein D3C75_1383020 [compost metagenome]